jgi:hypothetical protein
MALKLGDNWADAMDVLMPGWTEVAPTTGGKPSIIFPEGQKERFDNVFLEAWGTFAAAHQPDGIDCIIAYMQKGMWRKMTTAATKIQKDLGTTDIFSLTDDQLRDHFIGLFEQKYDGFKDKVYKGARGVGAELSEEEFMDALIAKVLGATGGARKGRKSGRKTRKAKKSRKSKKTRKTKKSRKAKKSRKTKKSRKAKKSRKTHRKGRKAGRKAGRKTSRKTRKSGRKH